MNNKRVLGLGAAVVALLIGGDLALADSRRAEARQRLREVHRSRVELRKDLAELRRDRAELHRDLRRSAPAREIARDRARVRQSFKDVARSRHELNRDRAGLGRDLHRYGGYGRPYDRGYPDGWWRQDNRWERGRFAPRYDDRANRHRSWHFGR